MKGILRTLGALTGAAMLFDGSMLSCCGEKYLEFWRCSSAPAEWNDTINDFSRMQSRTRQYLGIAEIMVGGLLLYLSIDND